MGWQRSDSGKKRPDLAVAWIERTPASCRRSRFEATRRPVAGADRAASNAAEGTSAAGLGWPNSGRLQGSPASHSSSLPSLTPSNNGVEK